MQTNKMVAVGRELLYFTFKGLPYEPVALGMWNLVWW